MSDIDRFEQSVRHADILTSFIDLVENTTGIPRWLQVVVVGLVVGALALGRAASSVFGYLRHRGKKPERTLDAVISRHVDEILTTLRSDIKAAQAQADHALTALEVCERGHENCKDELHLLRNEVASLRQVLASEGYVVPRMTHPAERKLGQE